MNQFLQTLNDAGYRQFYLAFGDANLRQKDWPLAAKQISGPLLDLVKLFLLQQPVARKRVAELLGEACLAEFIECGILIEKPGAFISNAFFLIYCRGHVMFTQQKSDTYAYFGDDSLALVAYQTPAPGGRVLDICSGPGIQSFVAATYAESVTGVEIRNETWRIAEINRRLNGQTRVKFVNESDENFIKTNKETFDRILFNPPLVPMVPGYRFAFVGNGGPDGLDITRRIVNLYHKKLTDTGALEFIGVELGCKDKPMACDELKGMARKNGLGGRIHLFSQHPIRPFAPLFEASVFSLARDNGLDIAEARKILSAHFKKLGADAYWLFFASLRHAHTKKEKEVSIVDVSKSFWGHWFV